MTYTDAQGRPEIVMHPDVLRGGAAFRLQPPEPAAGPGDGLPQVAPGPGSQETAR